MIRFKDFILESCKLLDGLASGKDVADLAKKHKVEVSEIEKQLSMGMKVEKEHTKNPSVAKKIAMDHVWEDPKYYDKLKKMETESAPANAVGFGNIAGVSPGEYPPGTARFVMRPRRSPERRFLIPALKGVVKLPRKSPG